jgi:RimJ/RimL family protein N-acetyltransferase
MSEHCDLCDRPGRASSVELPDGSVTVCSPCARLAGDGDDPIWVRPLDVDDLELVLAWRSNPVVYEHFRRQEGPLEWDPHVSWFESRPEDRFDYVIRYGDRRVGSVNLTETDEVGIYLGDPSARGHGVATRALGWLCERFADREPLRAEIHRENDPSRALFERCGFERVGSDGEWQRYRYRSEPSG